MESNGAKKNGSRDVQRNEIRGLALQSVCNKTKNPEQHKAALGLEYINFVKFS